MKTELLDRLEAAVDEMLALSGADGFSLGLLLEPPAIRPPSALTAKIDRWVVAA